MRKLAISIVVVLLSTLPLQAQTRFEGANQIGVGMNGGMASFGDNTHANFSLGGTIGINANYVHFFTTNWGVLAGVDLNFSRSFLRHTDIVTHTVQDIPFYSEQRGTFTRPSQVEYRVPYYTEHLNNFYIAIPLQVVLQGRAFDFSISDFYQSYISLGVKFALPLKLTAKGYFQESTRSIGPGIEGLGVEINESVPGGTMEGNSFEYDAKATLSPAFMILGVAEAGTVLKTNEHGAILMSFYIQYQLTPNTVGGDLPLLNYDNNRVNSNGYLASDLADKLRYFQFGIRLQYNFLLK